MSAAVDEVMEKLKAMTLLEASELVKAIEETFDVDASATAATPNWSKASAASTANAASAARKWVACRCRGGACKACAPASKRLMRSMLDRTLVELPRGPGAVFTRRSLLHRS